MKQALLAMLKKPTTIIGIMTALLFQVVEVKTDAEAQRMLNERELQMVVRIPADFSAKAAAPELIKSMMTGMAAQITASVNKQAIAAGPALALARLGVPEAQIPAVSGALSERVTSDIRYTNPVQGVNNQMVPLMLVLASFVGAMIMGMNLEQSDMAAAAQAGRLHRFGARALINLGSAVLVSLAGSSLVMGLGGQAASGFLALWGFQALFVLTFMFVSQLFLIVFGMSGMLFNMVLLSSQLVSSGAMVPRELLPEFYRGLSDFFPATYAVEGSMNLLFGGPGIGQAAAGLLYILAASVGAGALAAVLRKRRVPSPAVVPAVQG